jgi:hypothetical protein
VNVILGAVKNDDYRLLRRAGRDSVLQIDCVTLGKSVAAAILNANIDDHFGA